MRLRLTDANRVTLGVESEWLALDLDRKPTANELEHLEQVPDRDQRVLAADALALYSGWDEAGRPVTTIRGLKIRVWVALRRNGVKVRYIDLDFDVEGLEVAFEEAPVDAPEGKAPAESETSADSTTS